MSEYQAEWIVDDDEQGEEFVEDAEYQDAENEVNILIVSD